MGDLRAGYGIKIPVSVKKPPPAEADACSIFLYRIYKYIKPEGFSLLTTFFASFFEIKVK